MLNLSEVLLCKMFDLSNGAETLLTNLTFSQIFCRQVAHPFEKRRLRRYSDCIVIHA